MRQLDNHLEKLDQHLTSYIRINSKWSRNLNAERTQPHTCQKKTWMELTSTDISLGIEITSVQNMETVQQC